ncbi:MAG: ADP-ribose pyrophosphatase [Candidatus Azotimanducaceae bacterium]|jgi:ADP-ribose pyrophosphatase
MSEIKPWRRLSSRTLAECRIFDLHESTTESPETGAEHQFYFIETADWVNIVPITDNNEVVCIRQFRHGNQAVTIEIPGGMVDPGEDPAIAAARECLEETGYHCDIVTSLGVLAPNPAVFDNEVHTYWAKGVKPTADIQNTATEKTEVVLIPLEDIPDMLMGGDIDHALVVATLWRLLYLLKENPYL